MSPKELLTELRDSPANEGANLSEAMLKRLMAHDAERARAEAAQKAP